MFFYQGFKIMQLGYRSNHHWAVFISGRGSNLGSLMQCSFLSSIRLVVSSRQKAYGLKKAKRYGAATKVLSPQVDWQDLLLTLENYNISKIFLAGFMKILPAEFINKWAKPIVNIHPSLLPKYPGLNSIERSFKDKSQMGCTLHKVIDRVDMGDVIFSAAIPQVSSLETAQFLIHVQEQKLGRNLMVHNSLIV